MTFDKDHNCKTFRHRRNDMIQMDSAMVLQKVLLNAKMEDRITYGVYQSARKFGDDPDNVMLCLHANDSADEDAAIHIYFMLMEAFCRENAIRLMKVCCHEHLSKLLEDVNPAPVDNANAAMDTFVCLLVDFPKELDATTRCFLEHYHALAQEAPFPHVSLVV